MKIGKGAKRPLGWKRIVLIVFGSLLGLVLVTVASLGLWINHLMNQIPRVEPSESRLSLSEVEQLLASDPDLVPIETQPTETDSTEPTTTTPTPSDPSAPTDGTEPTQPADPSQPTDPSRPTEPSQPTEPKPTEPEPTEPKPTEPEPTEPKPTEPKPTEPEPTEPTEPLPDISDIPLPPPVDEPVESSKNIINILLIGQDTEDSSARGRSDSMILVTINVKAKSVTFTSFMRDAYVQIPGYPANKLNHAYQYGGMSLLNETLYANFGVEVDGDVEINFSSFRNVIDLLGGVDISLTQPEIRYMNHLTDWNLKVGMNHLNGEQALVYARLREIDSDYKRSERQRTLLLALVDAYKDQPADKMLSLLDDVMGLVKTNMTNNQMWDYGAKVVSILSSAKYNSLRIPADGTFKQGNVQVRPGLQAWFQYNIDFEANRAILRRIFGV